VTAHVGRRVGGITDAMRALTAHDGFMPSRSRLIAARLLNLVRRRRSRLEGLTAADHTRIELTMRETMERLTRPREDRAP
jgi:hypothetical protein